MKVFRSHLLHPTRNFKVCLPLTCIALLILYYSLPFLKAKPVLLRIQNWQDKKVHSSFFKSDYLNPQGRVIYNRVGKCGSRTMVSLLKVLAVRNNFKLIGTLTNQLYLSTKEQMEFVNFIEKLNPPFIYHQHIHYVDFQRFGGVQPVHINMIRDPVERTVSHYYFRRFGDDRSEREFKGHSNTRNLSIDDCVAKGMRECTHNKYMFYVIPFFCGQKPSCRENSRWALEQAKNNVRSKYLVVGILEDFESFLLVLEKLLPQQFKGVLELWQNPEPTLITKVSQTRTRNKKLPSTKTWSYLRKKLALEYEFYYFVREHFLAIRNELNITRTKKEAPNSHLQWNVEKKQVDNTIDNDDIDLDL